MIFRWAGLVALAALSVCVIGGCGGPTHAPTSHCYDMSVIGIVIAIIAAPFFLIPILRSPLQGGTPAIRFVDRVVLPALMLTVYGVLALSVVAYLLERP